MERSVLVIENPYDNSILKQVESESNVSILEKFNNLRSGFNSWKKTLIQERIKIIENFSHKIEGKKGELSKLLSLEVGKPIAEAEKEIEDSLKRIKFFTDNSSKWLEKEILNDTDSLQEYVAYEPLGITCVISAWNYPYIVGFNIFIPALIAGNTVAYKPSEFATLTAIKIVETLYESGLPKDVIEIFIGDGTVGNQLLGLPFDGYFFTGTYETGLHIAKAVAPKLSFLQLELGGKDPLYITNEIDNINEVAQLAVEGTFYNNGQSCCAVKRIYVHNEIYDKFIDLFKEKVENLKIGNPLSLETQIGPLTRKQQIAFLDEQISEAVNNGAIVLTGGGNIQMQSGNFFQPTVLINVNHKMSVMRKETFGPIVGVMKISNDDEAIGLMKDTEFGLTASVFCNNKIRAEYILNEMDAGTVYLNCCDRVSDVSPWAGRKHSGLSPNHSYQTIRTFVQTKAFYIIKK